MKSLENIRRGVIRQSLWVFALVVLCALAAPADAPEVAVQLDISKAGPRKIEAQTEGRILADYRLAWADIAQGLNTNDPGPFAVGFVGAAKKSLDARVADQRRSGVTTQYSSQTHQLQAVFYAPEGDLIELHDTAELDMQLRAGGKVIHEDHGVHRYVVLMTPGADRWVIRELTEVAQF
jgi:hypothetical protein